MSGVRQEFTPGEAMFDRSAGALSVRGGQARDAPYADTQCALQHQVGAPTAQLGSAAGTGGCRHRQISGWRGVAGRAATFMFRAAPWIARTSSTARSSTSSRVRPEFSALARLPERTVCEAGNMASSVAHLWSDASRSRRFRCASSVRRPPFIPTAARPFPENSESADDSTEVVRTISCESGDPFSDCPAAPPESPMKEPLMLGIIPPIDGNRFCNHELGSRPGSLAGTC